MICENGSKFILPALSTFKRFNEEIELAIVINIIYFLDLKIRVIYFLDLKLRTKFLKLKKCGTSCF